MAKSGADAATECGGGTTTDDVDDADGNDGAIGENGADRGLAAAGAAAPSGDNDGDLDGDDGPPALSSQVAPDRPIDEQPCAGDSVLLTGTLTVMNGM
jgi:hypothetical protein